MKFLVYIRLMTNLRRVIKTYYIILALNLKGKKIYISFPKLKSIAECSIDVSRDTMEGRTKARTMEGRGKI